MSTPLLTTKLHIPRPRLELVARPLLIERLNAGLSGKLTLVAAPAGYVISAFQTVDSSLGKVSQTVLQSSPLPPIETILTILINEIAAYGHPLILGLDDYHEITTPEIHADHCLRRRSSGVIRHVEPSA